MADTWFVAKEWKARLVEFAGRRMLRNVANGETTTYDVSRSEGQVSQEGDAFNTKNMNDLEQRVANGFADAKTAVDTLSRDLNAINDNGAIKGMEAREDGVYITYSPTGGADTVTKKLGSTIVLLGTVTTEQVFDLSMYPGFKNFALDTNIIGYVSGNYDADTGTLTIYTSSVSDTVTVSGYGYVMDGDIKRTGNGRMTGKATVNYPKQVYLLY